MSLTLLAAIFAALAALFLGLRAQMLKPDIGAFPDSPRCVRWASFGLSLVCALYVVAVWLNGYRATATEACLLAGLALYAFLLWVNLYRQGIEQRMSEIFDR